MTKSLTKLPIRATHCQEILILFRKAHGLILNVKRIDNPYDIESFVLRFNSTNYDCNELSPRTRTFSTGSSQKSPRPIPKPKIV